MINQQKELISFNDKHFIIEISLILYEKLKKIIISLFISDNIKVKELKQFISKDFDFPINTINFFSPFHGILEDSYEFLFEQDKKINLDLILNVPTQSANDLNYKNVMKNQNIQKNVNEYKIIKKNESKDTVTRNNDFLKMNYSSQLLNNSNDEREEDNIFPTKKTKNNKINIFNNNINEKNEKVMKTNIKIKNDKFNYFSTKKSEKNLGNNIPFLNKKRLSTTYRESKSKKETTFQNQKNSKKIKIINFNINKTINQNDKNSLNKDKIS